MTWTDELAESLLARDVHVMVNASVSDAPAEIIPGSVIAMLPLVGRLELAQPSFAPPPEATQLVALVEVQLTVVAPPGLSVVGEAVRVAETTGHVTTTEAWAC
jgi:hypothetical protein